MGKILGNLISLGKAGKDLLLLNYLIIFEAWNFRKIKNLPYSSCHSSMLPGPRAGAVTLILRAGVWPWGRVCIARKHPQTLTTSTVRAFN